MKPVPVSALPRVEDRCSFVYLERCVVHCEDGALTAQDADGIVHIPAASLLAVLFGPGVRVTHKAMALLGDCGASAAWVGEEGVRFYASGRPLSTNTVLLEQQARRVVNRSARLAVARKMYAMRFPGENIDDLTMQQLRGREGVRVRQLYREIAERHGVEWRGRAYEIDNFADGDPINQALSAGAAALYGVCHAVIAALGCSPGLGFIHTGHSRSFVYDIADLYKADISIPAAFEIVAAGEDEDPSGAVRRRVRDNIRTSRLIPRIVKDVVWLLGGEEAYGTDEANVVSLWDYQKDSVPAGVNYADDAVGDW